MDNTQNNLNNQTEMERRGMWKVILVIYTALSLLAAPFLLIVSMMSLMLFDDPDPVWLTSVIFFGVIAIPVSLFIANIVGWVFFTKNKKKKLIITLISPLAYTLTFLFLWWLLGLFAGF